MTPAFSIRTTRRFERMFRSLLQRHPDLRAVQDRAREILGADPYNRSRQYHIKKLEGISPGDGQYRLSLGRWRFRYDISGRAVVLHYCGLRREDTYR
jgi:hypothetical protein